MDFMLHDIMDGWDQILQDIMAQHGKFKLIAMTYGALEDSSNPYPTQEGNKCMHP